MSETIFNNSGSVTTILGTLNQFHSFAQLEYYDDVRTTLNTKYGLNANQGPTTVPLLKYFGIGIQGYKNTDGNQGARPFQPKCTNMDLYTPIPFRVVPTSSDLTSEERTRYRLRVVKTIGSVEYALYYLKTIVWDPSTVEIVQKDTDDVETTYSLDPGYLNPVPTDPETGGSVDTNNRIIVRCTGCCEVTGAEVLEAVDVLYNGDLTKARISEMGFYTGCDVGVDANEALVSGSGVNTEAIYVQLAKHRCTLGTDLSDSGSSMIPYVSFESASILASEV